VFDTLSDRLHGVFTGLRGKGRLSEADVDATCREIRLALLDADVALPVVRGFVAAVKQRALGEEVSRALNPAQQVVSIVGDELVGILGGETRNLRLTGAPPHVVLLAGLQGTGKTTLAGKLGKWLAGQRHWPLLVAADLQRPNAVQQLQVVGQQAGVDVFAPHPGTGSMTAPGTGSITEPGNSAEAPPDPAPGDPVAVARQAIEHARAKGFDVVVVDTAGRLGVDEAMMAQAAAIRDAVSPQETLFVVDAMTGQDAVATAEAFRDGVGFTGVVLTKLDGDARGGAALSVAEVTGVPIMFASTGEKLTDFDVFHPERMASRILGEGDLATLLEQAQAAIAEDEAEQMAAKLVGEDSELTLDDFVEQLAMVRRMGPLSNVLGMLPGMGQFKDQIADIDERAVDRKAAIVYSMTPAERRDPKILNGSRRRRIAAGSGVTVTDVNQLVDGFFEARKQMKQALGSMPGMPGGRKRGKQGKGKAGKKGKKGRKPGSPAPRPGGPLGLPPNALRGLPGLVDGGGRAGDGRGGAGNGGSGLPADLGDLSDLDLSKLGRKPGR
jgi:signal recognition particle subunit SRP54